MKKVFKVTELTGWLATNPYEVVSKVGRNLASLQMYSNSTC